MWLIATVIVLLLYFYHQKYKYFERLGIPHLKPLPLYGSFFPILSYQCSMAELLQRVYNVNREAKYVGMFDCCTPTLLIRDLDLIKLITIKKFEHFTNQSPLITIDKYKSESLISLRGSEWRKIRTIMSPSTTAKKMRELFPLFEQVVKRTAAHLSALPVDQRIVDLWDVVSKFTCDATATSFFGLDVDSITNPENEFYVNGSRFGSLRKMKDVIFLARRNFPKTCKALGISILGDKEAKSFKDAMTSVMKLRDETGTIRQDILQYVMDTRANIPEKRMTEDDMAANLVFTIQANISFTGLAICTCLFETAMNQEVQKKLQEEIDQVLKNSSDVTLETINSMKYMEAVVNETLRMYPPIPLIARTCTKRFELPPTLPTAKPYVIEEGEAVFIPVYAIYRDPEHFPEPDKFNPDRFDETAINSSSRMSMAFGMGPRMCMGNRYSVLLMKTFLFYVFANCELKPCSKSVKMRLSAGQIMTIPADTLWLDIQPRNKGVDVKGG